MNFLFPAFLLGAIAIAIPIALHFLRRDVAPEVPFSAVRLIRQSPIDRSRRRRLRDLLLLAARVAALMLLAAAFARPYAAGPGAGSDLHIVALDRSFSVSGARFEEVRRLASAAVDDAPRSARIAVVAFDDHADLLAPPGGAPAAREVIAGLQPGAGATRYEPLMARAADIAAGSPAALVVVTDLQRSGWDERRRGVLPASIALTLRDVGPAPPNLAVIDLRPAADRVAVTVRNSGPARDARLGLTIDGRQVVSRSFSLGEGLNTLNLDYRGPFTGALTAWVDDPDGLDADNRRHAVLDQAAGASVLIVVAAGRTDGGFYLARALDAAPDEDMARPLAARTVEAPAASGLDPAQFGRIRTVVLLGTRGLDRRARDAVAAAVRQGAGLLIAAGPEVEPDVISTMFGWQPPLRPAEQARDAVRLAPTDLRHPIFRPFGTLVANLGLVSFHRAWSVDPAGWEVVGRFTDGSPALLERREGTGRVVLFASDLDRRWNDFPLQPVFVPFVIESLRHLGAGTGGAEDYMVAGAPAGIPPVPGIHPDPETGRPVAVNVDPRETLPERMTPAEFEAMIDRVDTAAAPATDTRARDAESRQSLWRYGLLLMLAALVAESFVGRPG